MPSCESCQARLLDFLYDLLDAEERSGLQTHLADCAACQAALDQATQQRGLLAAAARLEFPEVSFRPPVTPAAQDTPAPQTLPIRVRQVPGPQRGRTRPRPVRHWGRYAAAAAVILALGSFVLSGQWLSASHADAKREVDAGAARIAEARARVDQAAKGAEEVCQIHNKCVAEYRAAATWHGVPPEAERTKPEYLTLLTTDRPVYRSGLDTIHYRALVLDRYTLRPAEKDFHLVFELKDVEERGVTRKRDLSDHQGAMALRAGRVTAKANARPGQEGIPARGVDAGEIELDAAAPEGEYQLTVREAEGRIPPQQQNLYVRRATVPLPPTINKGQAHDMAKFTAAAEPLVTAIPLELRRLQVTFYPEGGSLVAGRANRVYFQCHTPSGAPAELRGLLLIDGKPSDLVVTTAAETPGTGVFELTPEVGRKYSVRVVAPAATGYTAALPAVTDAVSLRVDHGVAGPGQPVKVRVLRRDAAQPLVVALSCRGHLLDSQLLAPGQTDATLKTTDSAGGVLQVAVYEEFLKRTPPAALGLALGGASGQAGMEQRQLAPVARRLVYRHPAERLDVTLRPEQKGDETVLSLATADAKGNRVPSVALVAVTYRSPTGPAAAANAPTMPLLTELPRADGAGDADLLVVPGPASDDALDRVLATRTETATADAASGDSVLEVLNEALVRTRREAEEKRKSSEKTAAELAEARDRLALAHEALDEARDNPTYLAALACLAEDGRLFEEFRNLAAPVLTGLFVVALLASAISALRRSRTLPWCLAGAACAGLWLAFLLTGGMPRTPATPPEEPSVALTTVPEKTPEPWPVPPQPESTSPDKQKKHELQKGTLSEKMQRADKRDQDIGGASVGPSKPAADLFMGAVGDSKDRNAEQLANSIPKLPAQQPLLPSANTGRMENRVAVPAPAPGNQAAAGNAIPPMPAEPGAAMPANGSWLNRMTLANDAMPGGNRGGGQPLARKPEEGKGFGQSGAEPVPTAPVRAFANERAEREALQVQPAQTLYWHPAFVLPDGRMQVSIDPDEPEFAYQVTVFAHTADGRLGAQTVVLPRRDVPSK